MASINEKINYINETKSLIKDRLNDLGSEINNETTFREYNEKIKDLYEEWPKTSNENEIIKLNNTKNAKIDMILKGNTKQLTSTGINLISSKSPYYDENNGIKRKLNKAGSLTFSGKATSNVYVTFTNNITLKSNTTYTTLIQNRTLPSGVTLYYNDNANIGVTYADTVISPGGRIKTYTTGSVTGTISIGILIQNGFTVDFTIYPMLVEGSITLSTMPDYEPYTGGIDGPNPNYPQDIYTVTGENIISICGKNLLDSSVIKQNMYVCPCKKGDVFTFSFTGSCSTNDKRVFLRTHDGIFTNSLDSYIDNQTVSITDTSASYNTTITSTTDGFIYIRTASGIANYTLSNLMVEKGSTATTYEPHQNQEYKIYLVKNILNLSSFKTVASNGIILTPNFKNNKLLYITSEGTYTEITYFSLTNTQKIEPNTIYTLSGAYNSSARLRLREYDANGNNLSEYFDQGYGVTFVSNPNVTNINVQIVFYAQNDDAIFYPMLEKNNQITDYCPYKSPISLLKIGTYQDNFIKNNNLFNNNVEIKEAYPYTTTGVEVSYNNSDKTYSYVNCCKVKKDKTYTIAYNQNTPSATADRYGVIVDKNNIVLQQQLTWRNNTSSITFTPTYDGYLIMSTDKNATEIQINEGSNVLPYEQYNTNQWYLKKEIGKIIINEKSTFNGFSTHSGTTYITVNAPQADAKRVNENQIGVLCDKLRGTTIGKTWNGTLLNSCSLPSNGNYIQICLPYSIATTETELKTWLSNNNLTIYYWLSTPEYVKVDEDLSIQLENLSKAHSYDKQTNIFQNNNNLSFIITANALLKNSN